MTDAPPVFADWMIHLIVFLVISAIVVTGYRVSTAWISAADYNIPEGIERSITNQHIASCFAAQDHLTSQQLNSLDLSLFTPQHATSCFSSAYKLTMNDKTITTSAWDPNEPVDETFQIPVEIASTDATMKVEVQHG